MATHDKVIDMTVEVYQSPILDWTKSRKPHAKDYHSITYKRISERFEISNACQCMTMMNATEEYFTFFSCGVCWNKTAIFHTG